MKTLDLTKLKSWMDQKKPDLTLINVLSEEDFEKSHIPGSHNIPVDRDDFVQAVERVAGGKDSTIVVYCASFDCDASPKAAKQLDEAGFTNVYDFDGGMKEWLKAGYDVARKTIAKATR